MVKKNYYAVKSGRSTGIFKTWAECNKNIKGYSGAVYKGFVTLEEAEAYLNGDNSCLSNETTGEAIENPDYPIAYVDGSFNAEISVYSFGAAIIRPDGEVIELSGTGNNPEAVSERNVAGELLGAMTVIKWAYENGFSKILIKHDYEGIARWARGEWQAKKYCSTNYVNFLSKYKGKLTIIFEKVPAHSGVYYNEVVDKLAKKALTDIL